MKLLAAVRGSFAGRLGAVSLVVGLLAMLSGCSSSASSSGPVTLTFWSWVPHLQKEVSMFEKSHPDINVKLVNAGQGADEYTKLRTALKAQSGAPDVVQIEFQYLPTFEQIGALADLSKYGADKLASDYVPWTWDQVTKGSAVYAIPQDSGPMGLLYRKDIFDRYHLSVPKTWSEFAHEAAKLHEANPDIFLTDFAANDAGWFNGLIWQAGARPFDVNGTSVRIDMDSASTLKVADYWGKLVEQHLVATDPDFTNAWYSGFNKDKYATWITAAWGPVFLAGFAGKTSGKWQAAPLPQWSPGESVSANWGGSTDAVTTQSEHPKEAAELAIWINHDEKSATMLNEKSSLFPTLQSVLGDPSFTTQKLSFYGGQQVNKVFIESSQNVDLGFQWSPFQDYVYSQMTDQLGGAINGKTSFSDSIHQLQSNLVSYAKQQGFKVSD